jgi:hypothetical protein
LISSKRTYPSDVSSPRLSKTGTVMHYGANPTEFELYGVPSKISNSFGEPSRKLEVERIRYKELMMVFVRNEHDAYITPFFPALFPCSLS